MQTLFWTFLPDEALILVLAGAGVLLILGFRQLAVVLVATLLLFVVLAPFVEGAVLESPSWVSVLILIVIALALLRGLLALLIGQRASGHAVGILTADAIKLGLKTLLLPVRLLRWMLTGGRRRG